MATTYSITLRPCVQRESELLDQLKGMQKNNRQKHILVLLGLALPHTKTISIPMTPVAAEAPPERIRIYLSDYETEAAIAHEINYAHESIRSEYLRNMILIGFCIYSRYVSVKAGAIALDLDISQAPAPAEITRIHASPAKLVEIDRIPVTKSIGNERISASKHNENEEISDSKAILPELKALFRM